MSANKWPWSAEEEAEWQQELFPEEYGWMEELIDQLVSNSLAGSAYDPLQQDEAQDQEVVLP